jgi:hypothetical protein
MKAKLRAGKPKRSFQPHATEVEFVVVKDRRLGKTVKAVPLVKKPSPRKMTSTSKPLYSNDPQGSPSKRRGSGTAMPSSPDRPYYEDDRPIKKVRCGKVR